MRFDIDLSTLFRHGCYGGHKVAGCIAVGKEGLNYDKKDNEKFLISEARAVSIGHCLATHFYKELEWMVNKGHYVEGYIFPVYPFASA